MYQFITNLRRTLIHDQSAPRPHVTLPASNYRLAIKRGFDISGACFLLVLFAPLMLFLWILIAVDCEGSPIYVQRRRGYKGKMFLIYKFRTMMKNAHPLRATMVEKEDGKDIIFKFDQDHRITRLGATLRKYSLDELPQLFNVIKGDMSLVGPRPFSVEVFEQEAVIDSELQRWIIDRHGMKPGMTGLWQIYGRNDLPREELIRLDLEYVRNWTLRRDFSILLGTLPAVILGKGAY